MQTIIDARKAKNTNQLLIEHSGGAMCIPFDLLISIDVGCEKVSISIANHNDVTFSASRCVCLLMQEIKTQHDGYMLNRNKYSNQFEPAIAGEAFGGAM